MSAGIREREWGWITTKSNSSQRETNTRQPPNAKNKRLRRSNGDAWHPESLADHYGPLAHNGNIKRKEARQLETDGRSLYSDHRFRKTLNTGMWYKTSHERRKDVINPFISIFCILNHAESRFYSGIKTVSCSI